MPEFDVIVVGAGVMGLGCAYQLAKRGKRVCVIEQSSGGVNLNGASHGESRIIRLAHSDAAYVPLAIESYKLWRALEHEAGLQLYDNHGLLWLGDQKGTRERAGILARFNAPHEVLDNRQIKERYDHLDYDERWFGLLDYTAGTIYARRCMEALRAVNEKLGVHFRWGIKVTDWRAFDDRVVVSAGFYAFNARSVVFAVGGWLEKFAKGRLSVRVQPVAVPVFYWNIKPQASGCFETKRKSPNLIISDVWRNEELFMIPNADFEGKVKVIGGEEGLIELFVQFGVHMGEDFEIDGLRPTQLVAINRDITSRHLRQHLPTVDHRVPSVETGCLYANTLDRSFIIDRHPDHPNVVLASGFSGTGFKFAPAVGAIVADLLDGRRPRFDVRNFAVTREIDLARAKL
ncbi:Peroxisomal sarcosine oxidase [Aphelenchoides fujianensis]|nr:Peroxisomal sarcosine oxidase [Aphelenchoides fujianensis]